MSYFRRPPLSGVAEYSVLTPPPPPPPPPPRVRYAQSSRVRFVSMGSLGDAAAEMTEPQWRAAMLAKQTEVVQWQERWVKRDELQRWLQFGATLAIPLSAAIWRAIFKSAKRDE